MVLHQEELPYEIRRMASELFAGNKGFTQEEMIRSRFCGGDKHGIYYSTEEEQKYAKGSTNLYEGV